MEYKDIGNNAYANGKIDAAIVHYTQGITFLTDPKNSGNADKEACLHLLLSNRSRCHFERSRFEKSCEDAEVCTGIKPDFTKGWVRLGQSLFSLGKFEKCIVALERAVALDATTWVVVEADIRAAKKKVKELEQSRKWRETIMTEALKRQEALQKEHDITYAQVDVTTGEYIAPFNFTSTSAEQSVKVNFKMVSESGDVKAMNAIFVALCVHTTGSSGEEEIEKQLTQEFDIKLKPIPATARRNTHIAGGGGPTSSSSPSASSSPMGSMTRIRPSNGLTSHNTNKAIPNRKGQIITEEDRPTILVCGDNGSGETDPKFYPSEPGFLENPTPFLEALQMENPGAYNSMMMGGGYMLRSSIAGMLEQAQLDARWQSLQNIYESRNDEKMSIAQHKVNYAKAGWRPSSSAYPDSAIFTHSELMTMQQYGTWDAMGNPLPTWIRPVYTCENCEVALAMDHAPPQCICGTKYCSRDCYMAHWRAGNHEDECLQVRDNHILMEVVVPLYWTFVSHGRLPYLNRRDFHAEWLAKKDKKPQQQPPISSSSTKKKGSGGGTHASPTPKEDRDGGRAEMQFYLTHEKEYRKQEIVTWQNEMRAQIANGNPEQGIFKFTSRVLEQRDLYLQPFKRDSDARLAFKLIMADIYETMFNYEPSLWGNYLVTTAEVITHFRTSGYLFWNRNFSFFK